MESGQRPLLQREIEVLNRWWAEDNIVQHILVSCLALLKPYRETETYGQNFTEPPPELLEGEEVYEIENILNHRGRG